jgi:hypothetical protein
VVLCAANVWTVPSVGKYCRDNPARGGAAAPERGANLRLQFLELNRSEFGEPRSEGTQHWPEIHSAAEPPPVSAEVVGNSMIAAARFRSTLLCAEWLSPPDPQLLGKMSQWSAPSMVGWRKPLRSRRYPITGPLARVLRRFPSRGAFDPDRSVGFGTANIFVGAVGLGQSRDQAGTYVNRITPSPINSLSTRRSGGRGPAKNGVPLPSTTGRK